MSGPAEYKCADDVLDNLVKQDNENCVCKKGLQIYKLYIMSKQDYFFSIFNIF